MQNYNKALIKQLSINIGIILLLTYFFTTGITYGKTMAMECAYSGNNGNSVTIWVPRNHNPEFTEPGKTFNVEVRGPDELSKNGWNVTLKNEFKSWPVTVDSVTRGLIHLDTEEGWNLKVRLPNNISPELMELVIEHNSVAEPAISRRSVHIVPDLESDFYIWHQSDQHVTNYRAVHGSGKAHLQWGNGSQQAMEWIDPVINLTNPRFILHTGDNTQIYYDELSWAGFEEAELRLSRFLNGMDGYTAPSVVTTGNHDVGWSNYIHFDSWGDYLTNYFGQREFSFRMGSFYVLNSEWTTTIRLDWARNDYAEAGQDSSIKYRLIASHYYDGIDGSTTVAPAEDPTDLMLVGHSHRTQRWPSSEPYPVRSVGSALDYQRAAFWDFRRTSDGWDTPQLDNHADGVNVHRLVKEPEPPAQNPANWGHTVVSTDYVKLNDGTSSSNLLEITNQLPHNFYDGRVRFVMTPGDYAGLVRGGEILAQYLSDDESRTIVLIKVDIPENDVITVSINEDQLSNIYPEEMPEAAELRQNFPNPFNPSTQIQYYLPEASYITLEIYTLGGRLIQTLVDDHESSGLHTVTFNADNKKLSSGVYYYHLKTDFGQHVKQMTLIK